MNKKINTIGFIFLLIFLISAVSAANSENETIQSIQQPDPYEDLCKISVENDNTENLKLENTAEKISTAQKVEKKKVTIKAPDVKMHYKDGSKFTVTLKYQKKVIGNAKVQIKINGKTFTKTTDKKGKASIDLNYKSGTYTVLSSCAGNKEFANASAKSTVTIKSTLKCSDYSKYYKNTGKYSATFYDKKGKLLKNTAVKFKLNGKTYTVKTTSKGVANLAVDLKPGKYNITITNPKTTESDTKTVTVKSLIETKDLTFNESQKGKFTVKLYNSKGKVSPNKKVTLKVDGKTYTKTTNKNGIATLDLNLKNGKYAITTEYSGLKSTNKITVNKNVKKTKFTHITLISDYVNVTFTQVYKNLPYVIKEGNNGIIKMPKNEIFTIQIESKVYKFSNYPTKELNVTEIGYQKHLIPFDGSGVKSNIDRNKLTGNGIIISRADDFTQIEYQSSTSDNIELFGVYADKSTTNSETINYMQNDKIIAKVTLQTQSFDETGLKYHVANYYKKTIYDFNTKSYDEITKHNTNSIKFTNTGKPVTFSYFGNSIEGYVSKEDIITKFVINGIEELKKTETISYGLADKYRKTLGFEVLQAYSIINEKVTDDILNSWTNKNKLYLNRFGVMNVYGMHLASLETAWLADKLADQYSKICDVTWTRDHTATILGGINLDDTYLNILNADMGMDVTGNKDNIRSFRFVNSLQLPNFEEYSLQEVATRYWNFTSNSLDDIYVTITNNKFSIMQLGEIVYLFSEDGSNSAIIYNTTSGVSSVIQTHNNQTYKGSFIATSCDCCSVGIIPKDIIAGIRNALNVFSQAHNIILDAMNQIHPISKLAYKIISKYGGAILGASGKAGLSFVGTMVFIQQLGVEYRDEMVEKKDWHKTMDTFTFTRPGYLQSKKIYNIPNSKGTYDYIEVNINNDLSLDRNSAIYISNGNTKKLTKTETYKYFNDSIADQLVSVPTKYWDNSWKGIVK